MTPTNYRDWSSDTTESDKVNTAVAALKFAQSEINAAARFLASMDYSTELDTIEYGVIGSLRTPVIKITVRKEIKV